MSWMTPSTWVTRPRSDEKYEEVSPRYFLPVRLLKARREVAEHLLDPEGWRSHGLGIAQKYIGESTRLHIWDPSLTEFSEEETIHNHRFSFCSEILYGDLQHTEVVIDNFGDWQKAVFTHDKEEVSTLVTGLVGIKSEHTCELSAGDSYVFPTSAYHRAAATSLAVTLLHMGPKSGPCQALFPPGSTPRYARGEDTSESLAKILVQAAALGRSWI
jgi:hypothetical protein